MAVGAVKYWFNGLPLDGLSTSAGAVKYWFNGLPYDTLAPAAAPSGITAVANLTQDGNTVSSTGTVLISASANLTQDGNTLSATGSVFITATAVLTQAGNTIVATGVVSDGPLPPPTAPPQIYIDIRTAARSFTVRKRMF